MRNIFKVFGTRPKSSAMQNDQNLYVLMVKEGRLGVSKNTGDEFSIRRKKVKVTQ